MSILLKTTSAGTEIVIPFGYRARFFGPDDRRPETLTNLLKKHSVTEEMLTPQVKALLLDIMALQRGQELSQLNRDLVRANPDKAVLSKVEPPVPAPRTDRGNRQSEIMKEVWAKKRAAKIEAEETQAVLGETEAAGAGKCGQ